MEIFKNRAGKWDILRIVLTIGIIVYFLLIGTFEKSFGYKFSNRLQMNLYLPWGFIAIFISLYIFREYNRVKKARRNQRREEMNERRQELLDNVLKGKKKPDES